MHKKSLYSGAILILGANQLIETMAFGISYSYFPNYAISLGASVASIGLFTSSFPNIYYPGHDRSFRVVDGTPEYTGHSTLEIIVRRETEENLRIALKTEKAEKPSRL